MRPVMMRPRNGLASRMVPIIRNGPGCTVGAGTCLSTRSNSGARPWSFGTFRLFGHPAVAARTIKDREIELLVGRVQRGKQVEHLVDDFGLARIRTIDLVDDDDRAQAHFQRLANHELGLRHRPFSGIDQHDGAVDHGQDALDLAAEIGMAGRVDDVDARIFPVNGSRLGRMVMPRSFSRSLESMARSATRWFSRNEPDCLRSWSTSVVLPWSTCAMIAILRIFMMSPDWGAGNALLFRARFYRLFSQSDSPHGKSAAFGHLRCLPRQQISGQPALLRKRSTEPSR